jgi:hypothetical protein
MTSHDDHRDELASAYLDGELTPSEAALVEADPALLARVEVLRAVADEVATPAAPAPAAARDSAILAALDERDRLRRAPTSARRSPTVAPIRRRRSAGTLRALAAAAVVLAVLALVPLIGSLDGADDADVASGPETSEASDEAREALEFPLEESETQDDGEGADTGGDADDGGSEAPVSEAAPDALAVPSTQLRDLGAAQAPEELAQRAARALRTGGDLDDTRQRRPSRAERRCIDLIAGADQRPLRLEAAGTLEATDVLVLVLGAQVRIAEAIGGRPPTCTDVSTLPLPGG